MPSQKRARKRQGQVARREAAARARRRAQQKKRAFVGGITLAAIVLLIAGLAVGANDPPEDTSVSATSTTVGPTTTTAPTTTTSTTAPPPVSVPVGASINGPVPCPKPDGTSPRTTLFNQAPPMCIDPSKRYTAEMTTDAGVIAFQLLADKAPVTVNNFVVLARYHFFEGVSFHRVVTGFVDQGGDPLGTGTGGPGYKFKDELPQIGDYRAGTLAMANSGPDSNGSQFFVLVSDAGAQQLIQASGGKASYPVFGQVTSGMDVIVKINDDGSPTGVPKVVHKIERITITEA